MEMKYQYTDAIDAACQFSDRLELAANKPTLEFMKLRMPFLFEEVSELGSALDVEDDIETIDGALDVAFVAITQAYLVFRKRGFTHIQSVGKTRAGLLEVCRTNLLKTPPTEAGKKITKPEGWQPPRIPELLESNGPGFGKVKDAE